MMGAGLMNGKPSYSYKMVEGGLLPTQFPPDAFNSAGIPKSIKKIHDLPHGEVVCAVTINKDSSRVYTGGKGCVRVRRAFFYLKRASLSFAVFC